MEVFMADEFIRRWLSRSRKNTTWKKFIGQNKVHLALIFYDAKEAFDRVPHALIEEELKKIMQDKLGLTLTTIQKLQHTEYVLVNQQTDEKIVLRVCRGVPQGGTEGPVFFLVLYSAAMFAARGGRETMKLLWATIKVAAPPTASPGWGLFPRADELELGANIEVVDISDLAYADDLLSIVIYDTLEHVSQSILLWKETLAKFGIEMSPKTFVLLLWTSRTERKNTVIFAFCP